MLGEKILAVQFHPEVAHTDRGVEILRYFAESMCRAKADWNAPHIVDQLKERIRLRVGNQDHVLVGVTYVLDITELVSQLKQSGNWDPGALRVTFVPIKPGDPDARVRVGRVSIYYQ